MTNRVIRIIDLDAKDKEQLETEETLAGDLVLSREAVIALLTGKCVVVNVEEYETYIAMEPDSIQSLSDDLVLLHKALRALLDGGGGGVAVKVEKDVTFIILEQGR